LKVHIPIDSSVKNRVGPLTRREVANLRRRGYNSEDIQFLNFLRELQAFLDAKEVANTHRPLRQVVGRNASSTKPAQLLVFLVKDQGAPVFVPAQ
jgi:hypothetical protein